MINSLICVLTKEEEALKGLLVLLEKQYKQIVNKDIFGLEAVVEEIQLANKEIAQQEVERRKIVGKGSMNEIVQRSGNEELDSVNRSIKKTLHEITLQKETNELLIKQNLSYTNKMLNLINPKKETNVYNSYGAIRR